ncbi:MAG: AAA family ATPase [Methylococcales bacterium]|nr:AAA family ATPase [Methylococcales bacterium]
MSIKQVTIKSFKSIVDQTVELSQLNVFIGTNGAGKSNFLEAIGVLSCALDGQVSYNKLADRGIRLSAPEVFKSSFRNLSRKNTFSLDAEFDNFKYHANISPNKETDFIFSTETICKGNKKLGGRSNRGVSISSLDDMPFEKLPKLQSVMSTLEALGSFTEEELKQLSTIKKYAIYSLSTPILRGVSPDESRKEPLGLYGGGLAIALNEVILDAHLNRKHDLSRFFKLLDWFEQISVTDEISPKLQSSHLHTGKQVVSYIDKYMKTNFNNLYAYDVSEGALYILFILVLLLHQKSPDIFALDNVDNALNPGLVKELMGNISTMLEEHPEKQILMTTHNPTTLDAIDLFNPLHRLFVVTRNDKGHTEVNRIPPPEGFTRKDWIEKHGGMKLSEIWLSGLIGGLPVGF